MCGLKHSLLEANNFLLESHPTWVCGLKQLHRCDIRRQGEVTPYVGVWIETCDLIRHIYIRKVTPYVGVWIETLLAMEV